MIIDKLNTIYNNIKIGIIDKKIKVRGSSIENKKKINWLNINFLIYILIYI